MNLEQLSPLPAASSVRLGQLKDAHDTEDLGSWYVRYVALDPNRTTTWGMGFGVALIINAIIHPTDELWSASVVLDGEYGATGISTTVPVTFHRKGAGTVHGDLDGDETVALQTAARHIRDLTAATA